MIAQADCTEGMLIDMLLGHRDMTAPVKRLVLEAALWMEGGKLQGKDPDEAVKDCAAFIRVARAMNEDAVLEVIDKLVEEGGLG